MSMRRPLALLSLLLAGCADVGSGYPSLARRDYEGARQASPDQEDAVAEPEAADAGLVSRLTELDKWVSTGRQGFDSEYDRLSQKVRAASGASPGSENWVTAQLTLSQLQAAQYDSVAALAELDSLYLVRAQSAADIAADPNLGRINVLRQDALRTVDSQNDRLDSLRGALRLP